MRIKKAAVEAQDSFFRNAFRGCLRTNKFSYALAFRQKERSAAKRMVDAGELDGKGKNDLRQQTV